MTCDEPLSRYKSFNLTRCLMPDRNALAYDSRIASWWGAMVLAWEMVETEETLHDVAFERIVFARANLQVLGPVRVPDDGFDTVTRGFTGVHPPDAFWIISRAVDDDGQQLDVNEGTTDTWSTCMS